MCILQYTYYIMGPSLCYCLHFKSGWIFIVFLGVARERERKIERAPPWPGTSTAVSTIWVLACRDPLGRSYITSGHLS